MIRLQPISTLFPYTTLFRSFNDTLGGPIDVSEGWFMALGIFNGQDLRPIPGGGICQASTTMYRAIARSEEHTSELQSPMYLVCRLLLEKKKKTNMMSSRASI